MRYPILVIITIALTFLAGAMAVRTLDNLDRQFAAEDRV